jgi:ribonuclease PH
LVEAVRRSSEKGFTEENLIKDTVAAVSVGIVDGKVVLDLNAEEDSHAEVDMNFVMTGSGKFVEVQGTAERIPFSKAKLDRMLEVAQKGIRELLQMQKSVLTSVA